MLGIGRSWPIPWTLAAHVLRAARSIDEVREQLEQLAQQQEDQAQTAKIAAAQWQEPGAMLLLCCCTVPAIPSPVSPVHP